MELKLADQDMYGYRHTGPHEPPTRVRVIAGTQIPPDLVDLEPTDDFQEQRQYPDVSAAQIASMSEEEQQQAAKDREAAIAQPSQYNPDQPDDGDLPRARVSATAQHTAEDRAKASAANEKRARQRPKRSGADEAVGEE